MYIGQTNTTQSGIQLTPCRHYRIAYYIQRSLDHTRRDHPTQSQIIQKEVCKIDTQIKSQKLPTLQPQPQNSINIVSKNTFKQQRSKTQSRERKFNELMHRNQDQQFDELRQILKSRRRIINNSKKVQFLQ